MANENAMGGEFKIFLLDPDSSHELMYDSSLSIYSEYRTNGGTISRAIQSPPNS